MPPRFSILPIQNQDQALTALAKLIEKGQEHPRVRAMALKIVRSCGNRDDACELGAIYDWVKANYPYRADPRSVDFFTAADRILTMMEAGAAGGDCDEHTVLCASLAGSIGFTVGARAYGQGRSGGYTHVYAVALMPKKASKPGQGVKIVGLDTTVASASVGWQPPPGHYRTAWVLED